MTCRTVSRRPIFRLEPAERAEKFTIRAGNAWTSDSRVYRRHRMHNVVKCCALLSVLCRVAYQLVKLWSISHSLHVRRDPRVAHRKPDNVDRYPTGSRFLYSHSNFGCNLPRRVVHNRPESRTEMLFTGVGDVVEWNNHLPICPNKYRSFRYRCTSYCIVQLNIEILDMSRYCLTVITGTTFSASESTLNDKMGRYWNWKYSVSKTGRRQTYDGKLHELFKAKFHYSWFEAGSKLDRAEIWPII